MIRGQEKMNKFLDKIANWLALNKLSLNTNKTVYMMVGNYCDSVSRKIEIEIHKQKIKRVADYKYLGLIFDFNMKWDKHIQYIMSCLYKLTLLCFFSQLHKLWYNHMGRGLQR